MQDKALPEDILQFLTDRIDSVRHLEALLAARDRGLRDGRPVVRSDLGGRIIMLEGFLLGVIVTASLAAGAFFLKFWKRTRDSLFLAFGAAFLIEGINRIGFLFVERPNEGSPTIYTVRLLAFLLIVAAIVRKNRSAPRRP